jgi:undecaprenyl diphosphate synthase
MENHQLEQPALVRSTPRHVAIIMDGNGRWAVERNLPRLAGHRAGARAVREVVRRCGELGVQVLTLYAFSVENWARPAAEVEHLMALLEHFLKTEIHELAENQVRCRAIGDLQGLPEAVLRQLERAGRATADNRGLELVLALNYSGRRELAHAVAAMVELAKQHPLPTGAALEREIAQHLYAPDLPDPDLLIRTSGELRLSNFMLWQLAYTEIYVTPVYWPDFGRAHLDQAFAAYARRERRFGGLKGAPPFPSARAC